MGSYSLLECGAVLCLVRHWCPTLCNPMDCSLPGSSSMGFSRQKYWNGLPCCPPGDLPNPWIEPRSPTLQVDSLLSEPPGVPKNTGVGNQSLLQGNFPTQGWNWGLLHCRQILYQLRYQEANRDLENSVKATRRIKQGFVHLAQAP